MAEQRVQRRLAAILAADVVGYSRLMGEDEEATLGTLTSHREIFRRLVKAHRGYIFSRAGDSIFAEFSSPVEAVRCATEIQSEIGRSNIDLAQERRMRFRIGVNLGDVLAESRDLYGNCVNVAARLESLAPPGGLCVSETVASHVRDHLELELQDLGQHQVKNISQPVQVYRVPLESEFLETSPYRGLDVFEFEHADTFCGRANAIAVTCERIRKQAADGTAFLLIHGMSGSGKSSLMRAGLLPAIMKPGNTAGVHRFCVFQPSDNPDPTTALVQALSRETALPELVHVSEGSSGVMELFRDPESAVSAVGGALGIAARTEAVPEARIAVAVDQLEDLFRGGATSVEARAAFIALLNALARSGFVWVIATIRTDLLHHCASIAVLSELKDGLGSYELLPPTGPEIAQIIRDPARLAGLRFEEDLKEGRLEDVLQNAAARDPASLPLLAFVLDALYEAGKKRRVLTFADYHNLGGLEGAIAKRADEVVGALPDKIQAALPMVLRSLVTIRLRDEAVTARPASNAAAAHTSEQRRLVDALVGARLLVCDEIGGGEPVVRVAHEALISHWPRFQQIIADDRAFLETRARVQADTRRWLAEHRNPDLLLTGRRLAEAEEMVEARREEVDSPVVEYVDASASARKDREQAERARLERDATAARSLARHTRIAAAIAVALAVVAGVGAVVGFRGQLEARRQAQVAEENLAQARVAEQEAERLAQAATLARDDARYQLRRAQIEQARFRASKSTELAIAGDAGAAIALALSAMPQANPDGWPDLQDIAEVPAALVGAILGRRELAVLRGHESVVRFATFSPNGARVATASGDRTARLWDAASGAEVATLHGHQNEVGSAVFSPNGERLATASRDRTARLWDAENGAEIAVLRGHGDTVRSVAFSPDGTLLVTTSSDATARVWDAENGDEIAVLVGHTSIVASGRFSTDGRKIVTASWDQTARLWEAANGAKLAVLRGHEAFLSSATLSPDGTRVATTSEDGTARLWDAVTGTEIATLRGHDDSVWSAEFSPDGELIVTASLDGTARLWDASGGIEIGVMRGHDDSLSAAIFSPDGEQVVTTSRDGTARLWDAASGAEIAVLRGHEGAVWSAAYAPGSERLVTASADATARLWDVAGGAEITVLRGHESRVLSAAFSPDGSHAITASSDRTARLWDVASGTGVVVLRGHQNRVESAAISPDGVRVVTASRDGTARLWNAPDGTGLAVLSDHGHRVLSAGFSPDGTRIATTSWDGTTHVWNTATGAEVANLQGHEGSVWMAAFSPDGTQVATVSDDATARLWDSAGAETAVLRGHRSRVTQAEFSPNGLTVATTSWDGTARLWEARGGAEIAVLRGHDGRVSSVAFSPDSTRLVTASQDRTARLWDATDGSTLAVLHGHEGNVRAAEFSPDGAWILTASDDGTARLWNTAAGTEIAVLRGHKGEVSAAAFSPDSTRVVTASFDGTARLWPHYGDADALFHHARDIVDRLLPLTDAEKCTYYMNTEGCDDAR